MTRIGVFTPPKDFDSAEESPRSPFMPDSPNRAQRGNENPYFMKMEQSKSRRKLHHKNKSPKNKQDYFMMMENHIESRSIEQSYDDVSPKRSPQNSKGKFKPRAYLAVGVLSR